MAKVETAATRAPRGTKPVSQAFFTALEAVPEAQRAVVAKAAQALIRDELKLRQEKLKAAAARVKARAPAPKVAAPKAPAPKAAPPRKTPAPRKAAPAKAAAPVVAEKPAPKPARKTRRSPEPKIAA